MALFKDVKLMFDVFTHTFACCCFNAYQSYFVLKDIISLFKSKCLY